MFVIVPLKYSGVVTVKSLIDRVSLVRLDTIGMLTTPLPPAV